MNGLWRLPTRTIDPGLGVVIFDGLAAVVVATCTCFAIARRSRQWPEAWLLYLGMLLLSSWFVLHWIDAVVHSFRSHVTYSYILVGCLYNVARALSDVFVLWGTCRVLMRYNDLRPTMAETKTFSSVTIVAGLLGFLALYHVFLLFALSFAWLSFADLEVINAIAEARNGIEITFTAVQFISTILAVVWACDIVKSDMIEQSYKKASVFSCGASIALLVRSFCEVVIVGQLDRWPANLQDIARARDITYGLFSIFFVAFISFAIPSNATEDPLIRKENYAVEQVTTWIINTLEDVTEHGRKTAPTITTLLERLEASAEMQSSTNRDNPNIKIKRNEIRRLKALYADWKPIHKWQGEDGDSAMGSSPFATQTSRESPVVEIS